MWKNPRVWSFLFILYLIILLTGLSVPVQDTIKLDKYLFGIRSDHYIHALLFTPFMICQFFMQKHSFGKAYLYGIVFAVCCEFLHYFIPYRTFDLHDIYANLIGMSTGALFFLAGNKYFRRSA